MDTPSRGNNPKAWDKLLSELDEKLQLGLLDRLRRVKTYHFEESVLFIEPHNKEDFEYLSKQQNFQQLDLYAKEACGVEKVKVKALEE